MYLQSNPWAADAQLSPKSVVREMWERAFTFREFVSVYGLTRSEGAVLRYLSDAFKALRSGVPAAARTEEVTDIVEWLGELVRQVDSSCSTSGSSSPARTSRWTCRWRCRPARAR